MSMDDQEKMQISGDVNIHRYFAMIPHLVDDADISPHAYRLYGHIVRVVGQTQGGTCYQSTATLAAACHMSPGMITQAKDELVRAGFITIHYHKRREGGRALHVLRLVNVWAANVTRYAPVEFEPTSEYEVATSQYELATSEYEIKKNPFKKNNKAAEKTQPQEQAGLPGIPVPAAIPAPERKAGTAGEEQGQGRSETQQKAAEIGAAFTAASGLTPEKVGWGKWGQGIKRLITLGARPEEIAGAVARMREENLTCSHPGAIAYQFVDRAAGGQGQDTAQGSATATAPGKALIATDAAGGIYI